MVENSQYMSLAMGINAFSSLATGFSQSGAIKAQGKFQQMQYEQNARIAQLKADDAIERGDKAANLIHRKALQVQGSQRAAAAASGIEVNTGVSKVLQDETQDMSEIDIMTVKNNAWRESWGYKVEATQMQGAGRMAALSANVESTNTLLTGGLQALNYGLQAKHYYKGSGNKSPESQKAAEIDPNVKTSGHSGKTYYSGPSNSMELIKPEVGSSWTSLKERVGW